jgi:hypothetical protein
MPCKCPHCGVALVRSRRRGVVERLLLGPVSFIRPFRCPKCRYRRLRFTRAPGKTAVLLLLITVLVGILLIQVLLYVSDHARNYKDTAYQPKDMERVGRDGKDGRP